MKMGMDGRDHYDIQLYDSSIRISMSRHEHYDMRLYDGSISYISYTF